jgi:hypothetical protein
VFENGGAMIAADDGVVKAIAGEGEPPRRKDAKNFFIKHLGVFAPWRFKKSQT